MELMGFDIGDSPAGGVGCRTPVARLRWKVVVSEHRTSRSFSVGHNLAGTFSFAAFPYRRQCVVILGMPC